jgi:hypothetical protein
MLADIARHGGEDSGLVRWARLIADREREATNTVDSRENAG